MKRMLLGLRLTVEAVRPRRAERDSRALILARVLKQVVRCATVQCFRSQPAMADCSGGGC